jgi:GH24 family phage-related lysozyme (muramidase)
MDTRKRRTWQTVKRACRYFPGLGGKPCSRSTLYRLINTGKVRVRKGVTGRVLVHTGDLRALWGKPERRRPADAPTPAPVLSRWEEETLRRFYG